MVLKFTVSEPQNFQIDSIILENSKFPHPVDHLKNLKAGTLVTAQLELKNPLKRSQLAKMKKSIPHICPCHKIYRVGAVGLKKLQIYLKKYDFCDMIFANMWNLGQFREKLIFCQ